MAGDKVSDEVLREALHAYAEDGTQAGAARLLGWPRRTLVNRLQIAQAKGLKLNPPADYEYEPIPADDIPVRDIIEGMKTRYTQRAAHADAKKWRKIKINIDGPIAVGLVGDPHVDSDGTNWLQLDADVATMANTEGFMAINLGDSHNNWANRLAHLYSEQETSRATAIKLVEWLFGHDFWLALILGNHDMWNGGSDLLKYIAKGHAPAEDWQVQLSLVFPNGRECKLDCRHDFRGHSQYWENHGLNKHAKWSGAQADIYAAGHKHTWAYYSTEDALMGRTYHTIRARGYKHIDHYADVLGYGSQSGGSTMTCVIDPDADANGFITVFSSVQEAAEYLKFKRSRL